MNCIVPDKLEHCSLETHLLRIANGRMNFPRMPRHNRLSPVALFLPALAGLACILTLWSPFEAQAQSLSDAQNQFLHGKYESVIKTAQDKVNTTGSTEWRLLLIRSLLAVGRY